MMRINFKAEAARARRSAAELERLQRVAREKEDRYWRQFEVPKSRSEKKREEELEKRAEAAARRAEARRLAEQEEKELDNAAKKKAVKKVTEVELLRMKEKEQEELGNKLEEAKLRVSRTVTEKDYELMVSVSNTNRESVIEASTVEEAIARLTGEDNYWSVDRVPESRFTGFAVRSIAHDLKLSRLGIAN